MAFSGPARIITTYFNKSAHMTIPLIQKQIFTYIFCLWLIYTFFSILEFYFALFLPTMTITPTFYEDIVSCFREWAKT